MRKKKLFYSVTILALCILLIACPFDNPEKKDIENLLLQETELALSRIDELALLHLEPTVKVSASVLQSKNNSRPVYVGSASTTSNVGHAWVIDSYGNLKVMLNGYQYIYPDYLVHCNLGWGGKNSGWYASGLFSMQSGPFVFENGEYHVKESHIFLYEQKILAFITPQ